MSKRPVLQAEGSLINQGLKVSAMNAKSIIPAAAPFELGMSGVHSDLRDLMDMTAESVAQQTATALSDMVLSRSSNGAMASLTSCTQAKLWWRERIRIQRATTCKADSALALSCG